MPIEIVKADYANDKHKADMPTLLNVYATDPMGGGKPLAGEAKLNLVNELAKLPTLLVTCCLFTLTLSANALAGGVTFYPNPNPALPFSTATQVGNVVYLSGQIGDKDGKLSSDMATQAHQMMRNIQDAVKATGVTMDDIFKCTVMIDDMQQWKAFSDIYVTYFNKDKLPARSAFGADGLAMGAMFEVECMAYKAD
jgi:2-iminobutanoate/2-iminopropanoate deaminase